MLGHNIEQNQKEAVSFIVILSFLIGVSDLIIEWYSFSSFTLLSWVLAFGIFTYFGGLVVKRYEIACGFVGVQGDFLTNLTGLAILLSVTCLTVTGIFALWHLPLKFEFGSTLILFALSILAMRKKLFFYHLENH